MKHLVPVHRSTRINPKTGEWLPYSLDACLVELEHLQRVAAEAKALLLYRGHSRREYAHLALIAGIILIAAGIKQLLELGREAGHGIVLLAGGMALFMLGDVFFRWVMGIRPIVVRLVGTAVALALGFAET